MFVRYIADSNSGLTYGRYLRLIALSFVQMFWSLFIISLNVRFDYRNGLRPWTTWADVHSNFSHINQFSRTLTTQSTLQWIYFLWWTVPITSYIFAAFFITGRDSVDEYRSIVRWSKTLIKRVIPHRNRASGTSLLDSEAQLRYDIP
jgi:pheromone a factor receptor